MQSELLTKKYSTFLPGYYASEKNSIRQCESNENLTFCVSESITNNPKYSS